MRNGSKVCLSRRSSAALSTPATSPTSTPIPFYRQRPHIGAFANGLRIPDDFVVSVVVDAIQPCTDAQPLIRRGNQWMRHPHRKAVVLAMGLELEAVTGGDTGSRITAIARTVQTQLRAFGIEVLAVINTVVMLFVVTRRKQGAHGQLLGHACLRIAARGKQRLSAVAAAIGQTHAGGEGLSTGRNLHRRRPIGGRGWRHLRLQRHPRQPAHQCRVAIKGFTGQRALSFQLIRQIIDHAPDPPHIAFYAIVADISLDQHYAHQPLIKVLRR